MRIPVTALFQGQSEQPPWKRFPGQVDLAQNITLDPLDGAVTRNPAVLEADIPAGDLDPGFNYYICSLRQFRIFIRDGLVKVYDEDGTEKNVTDLTGTNFEYLDGTNRGNIDTTSSIDTVIICNKLKTVLMDATPDYSVKGEVLQYSQLLKHPSEWVPPGDEGDADPVNAEIGSHFKVITDENLDPAGYYEKTAADTWERVAAPADPDGRPDLTTWPHRLIYRPDTDDFVFDTLDANDRLSGNSDTNPVFPVVNSTIESVEFMAGRLAFIGRNSINLTASGDIFTLFTKNVNNIADDDRLSYDITAKNIGTPIRSEAIGDQLLIFCQNGQLSFGPMGDYTLSAVDLNGRMVQVGDFKTSDVLPGNDGSKAVFVDQYSIIRVFQYDQTNRQIVYLGALNEHLPSLFNGYTIEAIYLNDDQTYVCTTTNRVFVHWLRINQDQVEQSAWAVWDFNERIRHIDSWGNVVRLVSLGDTHSFMTYDPSAKSPDSPLDYIPRMDRLEQLTGNYIESADETEFTLTGRDAELDRTRLITTYNYDGDESNEIHEPVSVRGRKFRIKGKWTGQTHWAGHAYTFRLTLSKLYPEASGIRPIYRGHQTIYHKDTPAYTVEVTREGESAARVVKYSSPLGTNSLNTSNVATSQYDVLILGDARYTKISIVQKGPSPVTVSALGINIERTGR